MGDYEDILNITDEDEFSSFIHNSPNSELTTESNPLKTSTTLTTFKQSSPTLSPQNNLFSLFNQTPIIPQTQQTSATQLGSISHSLRITQTLSDMKSLTTNQTKTLNYHDDVLQAISQSIIATNKNIRDNNDALSTKITQLADITICSFSALAQQQQAMMQTQSSMKSDIDILKKEIELMKGIPTTPISFTTILPAPPEQSVLVQSSKVCSNSFDVKEHLPMAMLLASLCRDSLCCCAFFKGFLPIFAEDDNIDSTKMNQSLFVIHVPSFLLSLRISLSVEDNVIFAKFLNNQCWTMNDFSPFKQLFWDHFNQDVIKPHNRMWTKVKQFLPELNLDDFCWLPISSLHKLWLEGVNCSFSWPKFLTIQESMFRLGNTKQSFLQPLASCDISQNNEWFEFCVEHCFIPIRQVFCGAKRDETWDLLKKLAKVLEVSDKFDPVFLVCGSKFVTEFIKSGSSNVQIRAIYPCLPGSPLVEVILRTGERSVVTDSLKLDVAIKKFFTNDQQSSKPKRLPPAKRAKKANNKPVLALTN